MKRGPYFRYLKDPSLPIPPSTLRGREARAARALENTAGEGDNNNEEQEDAASLSGASGSRASSPDGGEDEVLSSDSQSLDGNERQSQPDSARENFNGNPRQILKYKKLFLPCEGSDYDLNNEGETHHNQDEEEDLNGSESEAEESGEDAHRHQSSSDEGSGSNSDSDDGIQEHANAYEENDDEEAGRDPIYHGCQVTLEESRLLIMGFALRFGLSDIAIQHLCKLVYCHLPLHRGHGPWHHFKKHIPSPPLVQTKFYCSRYNCKRPISFGDGALVTHCECGEVCDQAQLRRSGSYYQYIPVKPQLIAMFKNEGLRAQLHWEDENESDVVAGIVYKKCIQQGIICKNRDLTLQFNTDGVQLFKSSTIQLWPIQVCVNELPFKARTENIILCGLWYGDRKPNLNTFLTPFIEELNSLHNTGFRLNEHDQYITKVHTLLCTVDSVARAPLQNIKTFRGIEAAVGRGSTRLYQNDTLYPLRTQAQHIRDTQKIIAQPRLEAVKGVKGMANLLNLALFDISQSFVPDYLHCVSLGCTKTMIRHWTDGKNKDQPFYIDEKFEKGTRALREYILTIDDVYSTYVLLKFNTHLLTHVPQSVKNFGALWASSTFSYEHYNGMLAKMFRSSQAVPLQICKNYIRFIGLQGKLLKLVQQNNISPCVGELLTSLSCGKTSHLAVRDGDLVLMGAAQPILLNVVFQNVVGTLLHALIENDGNNVMSYKIFIYKNSLYHVRDNQSLDVRLNCVAQLNALSFLSITHMLKVLPRMVDARPHYVILGNKLIGTGKPLYINRTLQISSESYVSVVGDSDICAAYHPESIRKKCILTFSPTSPRRFLCYPLVNVLERD
ncbi:Halomucin [Frankliniella fusca]|uniref:Halomucin n=1 Tax=Frankliniella fusca TaxID=407009 RepID=A0AAE1GY82_9NEOP|nr:Halomucin [Frankliniella fusca]